MKQQSSIGAGTAQPRIEVNEVRAVGDSSASKREATAEPVKRKRGRPRKHPEGLGTVSSIEPKANPGAKFQPPAPTQRAARPAQKSPVEEWIARISDQVGKSAQSLVELGRLLTEAKGALNHGEWEQMFASGKLRFSLRLAQKLMQVAKHTAISKASNSSFLPPSVDALSMLARLDAEVVQTGINEGAIGPDMTILQAKQFALDQDKSPAAKAEKPFDYETRLNALVIRVNLVVAKVPPEQRPQFATALAEKVRSLASAPV